MKKYKQDNRYSSPWSLKQRIFKLIWDSAWFFLCSWTPKPFNLFRVFIFKLFGGQVTGYVFIHQKARIHFPWNVTLSDRAALGERSWIYSLDKITIGAGATIAQEAFLCTGSHNFNTEKYELITAPITIGKNSFVGARANILPGVTLGERTIIGIACVVSKDTLPNGVYVGNPSKLIKTLPTK